MAQKINYRFNKTARRPWISFVEGKVGEINDHNELYIKLFLKNVGLNPLERVSIKVDSYCISKDQVGNYEVTKKLKSAETNTANPIASNEIFDYHHQIPRFIKMHDKDKLRVVEDIPPVAYYMQITYKDAIFHEELLEQPPIYLLWRGKKNGAFSSDLVHATDKVIKAIDEFSKTNN